MLIRFYTYCLNYWLWSITWKQDRFVQILVKSLLTDTLLIYHYAPYFMYVHLRLYWFVLIYWLYHIVYGYTRRTYLKWLYQRSYEAFKITYKQKKTQKHNWLNSAENNKGWLNFKKNIKTNWQINWYSNYSYYKSNVLTWKPRYTRLFIWFKHTWLK